MTLKGEIDDAFHIGIDYPHGLRCYSAAGQFVFVVPELGLVTAVASKSIWSDYTAQICFIEIVAAF